MIYGDEHFCLTVGLGRFELCNESYKLIELEDVRSLSALTEESMAEQPKLYPFSFIRERHVTAVTRSIDGRALPFPLSFEQFKPCAGQDERRSLNPLEF